MQDELLRYPFEEKFKEDLTTYLQEKELVDKILPDTTDMEEKWEGIAEAYLPDGMREFAAYPTVSLGWMMYVGMAIAKYWDEDWELYSKVENLYAYLRDQTDFDHTDDYIREKVLLLNVDEANDLERLVGECAARTYSQLRRLNIEPSTKDAYRAFVEALHQLYNFGVAVELKRLGYHMTAMQ